MSFAELAIIAIVGIVVIGPEKLPQALKTTLKWVTRIKRIIADTRTELENQLGVDDIRREIHNEQVLESLKALKIAKEEAERETKNVSEQISDLGTQLSENLGDEDEGLFGEQRANHPPQPEPQPQQSPQGQSAQGQSAQLQASPQAAPKQAQEQQAASTADAAETNTPRQDTRHSNTTHH